MHNLTRVSRKRRLNMSSLTGGNKPMPLCPAGLAEDAENEAGYRLHPENTHLHHTVQ